MLDHSERKEDRVFTKYSKMSKRRSERVRTSTAKVRGLLKRLTDVGVKT
jgi:hypothetical protein